MKRSKLSLWLFVTALTMSALSAYAESESGVQNRSPQQWLEQMSRSHRELNYSGVLSYQSPGQMHSYRLRHGVVNGKEFEHVEPLSGGSRDLVRFGHHVSCIHPGHQLLRQNSSSVSPAQHYRMSLDGVERVADRKAVVLQIQPTDRHRYGYRLSLDKETGLLLRSELLSGRGRAIERFQFVMIEIGGELPSSAKARIAGGHNPSHREPLDVAQSEALKAEQSWQPSWVPQGFLMVRAESDRGGHLQTYSDGMTAFSVFLDPDQQSDSEPAEIQQGATVAVSTPLMDERARWLATVVGEIPLATARKIAASVRWEQP